MEAGQEILIAIIHEQVGMKISTPGQYPPHD